jgi:predicted hydrocarbon binding protein
MGNTVGLEMFRILRTSMVGLIAFRMGEKEAVEAIYMAGKAVGGEIGRTFLPEVKDLNEFVTKVKDILSDLKVGILKVVSADTAKGKFVIAVDECASCSGTPVIGQPICNFEGGIIAGLLKYFLKKEVKVVEVKCWALGDKTCEFEVTVQ